MFQQRHDKVRSNMIIAVLLQNLYRSVKIIRKIHIGIHLIVRCRSDYVFNQIKLSRCRGQTMLLQFFLTADLIHRFKYFTEPVPVSGCLNPMIAAFNRSFISYRKSILLKNLLQLLRQCSICHT